MVADSGIIMPGDAHASNRVDFAGGSVQSRILAATLRMTVKRAVNVWALGIDLPWPYGAVDHVGRIMRSVPGTRRHQVRLPRCHAEITRPAVMENDRYIIYMHGGAFIVGGRHLHRGLISRIAASLSSEVLAPDYRQLPRYTIADSVDDCVDAYRYALARGISPEKIAFMGDSAGGYLVFMTALVAAERGLPKPGAIVSMAPVIDFDLTAKLESPSATTDAFFTDYFARRFHAFVMKRCVTPESRRTLTDSDLSLLPPSLVQVSSSELLYPDAVRLAAELAKAGVPHELQVWQDQIHVFQFAAAVVPEAAHALIESTRFVEAAFAAETRRRTA